MSIYIAHRRKNNASNFILQCREKWKSDLESVSGPDHHRKLINCGPIITTNFSEIGGLLL